LLVILVVMVACDRENEPPSCILLSPLDQSYYYTGDPLLIWADVSDPDANLTGVKVFVDGTEDTAIANYPYFTILLTDGFQAVDHDIRVVATDEEGFQDSDEAGVTFREPVIGLTDYDGNSYRIAEIGGKTWMAENLRVTHYADGTPIEHVDYAWDWFQLEPGDRAYCWYNDDTANADHFGALYTWAAAVNGADTLDSDTTLIQGVCPDGWHLPTDTEWKEMEIHLGMSTASADELEKWRGDDVGGKLKQSGNFYWSYPNKGATDETGFSALPGRARYFDGRFDTQDVAAFWTATGHDSLNSIYRGLASLSDMSYRDYFDRTSGFSIRCVRDE